MTYSLASDTYLFEQPLRQGEDGKIQASFLIRGMCHQKLPDDWSSWLTESYSLELIQEPRNLYDPNAVASFTRGGKRFGYVSSFYNRAIYSLMKNGTSRFVHVTYLNKIAHPHWWVKVILSASYLKSRGLNRLN